MRPENEVAEQPNPPAIAKKPAREFYCLVVLIVRYSSFYFLFNSSNEMPAMQQNDSGFSNENPS